LNPSNSQKEKPSTQSSKFLKVPTNPPVNNPQLQLTQPANNNNPPTPSEDSEEWADLVAWEVWEVWEVWEAWEAWEDWVDWVEWEVLEQVASMALIHSKWLA
jgi:hypothetical protein